MSVLAPDRVRVSGPLAMFADGFREHLAEQGYSLRTKRELLQLLAHLSRWMEVHGLQASSLTPAVAEQFTLERRRQGYRSSISAKSPRRVLGYLESLGALPVDEPVLSPLEELLGAYARYLREERGIGERTVAAYAGIARQFLSGRPGSIEDHLAGLSCGEVNAFVLREFRRHSQRSAERVVYALRALLRYLHVQGLIDQPLAGGVLSVARRREDLPRGLPGEQVGLLLESCDRSTRIGRRDYAVLLLLARLGLRCSEIAALTLDDVDWREGEIVIRGKGSRIDRLPLSADVGKALADYLCRGRPRGYGRLLFLNGRAPVAGVSRDTVSMVVVRACRRVGMPPVRGHRLRHTVATELLRRGAGLAEIGQVLRHQDQRTTSIYAKVDRAVVAPGAAVAGERAMSPLALAVQEYLALRRALGYKLKLHGLLLPQFVEFLERRGASLITTELAVEWAILPIHASGVWRYQRLAIVRGFARYLQALDARHEAPPDGLLPAKCRRAIPYLYSPQEIEALIQAARTLRPPIRAATCEAVLGLLSVSGMRVSEVVALDRFDLELAEGRLTVRRAKNGHSREIALHPTTAAALNDYARVRDALCPDPKDPDAFFLSDAGARPTADMVRKWFDRLRHVCRLDRETLGRSARLHDIRHSFVLRTLLRWYQEDADVQAQLPLLSTFLGHVNPQDTFWYIENAPELLALAAERLERGWEESR